MKQCNKSSIASAQAGYEVKPSHNPRRWADLESSLYQLKVQLISSNHLIGTVLFPCNPLCNPTSAFLLQNHIICLWCLPGSMLGPPHLYRTMLQNSNCSGRKWQSSFHCGGCSEFLFVCYLHFLNFIKTLFIQVVMSRENNEVYIPENSSITRLLLMHIQESSMCKLLTGGSMYILYSDWCI